jgi:4Fe-4S ferredoxin
MYVNELPNAEITGKTFIENKCVYCGFCKEICPENTIEVVKPFDGEILIPEAEDCKDCKDCIEVCPCNALEIRDGFLNVNEERCILCGACVKACPLDALAVKRESMKLTNITSVSWQKIIGKLLE